MYKSTESDSPKSTSSPLPPDGSTDTPSPAARGDVPPDLRGLIPLSEVPDHLPRRNGKKAHRTTAGRWMTKGLAGSVLNSWMIGNQRFTTLEAIRDFVREATARSRSTKPPPSVTTLHPPADESRSPSPSTSRDAMRRRIDRIEENLKRFGL